MDRSAVFKRAWKLFRETNTGTFGEWLQESLKIEKAKRKVVVVKKNGKVKDVKFFWNDGEKCFFDLRSKRLVKLDNIQDILKERKIMYGSKVTKKELEIALAI